MIRTFIVGSAVLFLASVVCAHEKKTSPPAEAMGLGKAILGDWELVPDDGKGIMLRKVIGLKKTKLDMLLTFTKDGQVLQQFGGEGMFSCRYRYEVAGQDRLEILGASIKTIRVEVTIAADELILKDDQGTTERYIRAKKPPQQQPAHRPEGGSQPKYGP